MTKIEKIEDTLTMIKLALDRGNYKLLGLLQSQIHMQLDMYLKNIYKDGSNDNK